VKQWLALVEKQFSIGGYVSGGVTEPIGTVHLNGVMTSSGVHDGRDVMVAISPEALETVAEIVAAAIAARNAVKTLEES
jgi:hypothetical protein